MRNTALKLVAATAIATVCLPMVPGTAIADDEFVIEAMGRSRSGGYTSGGNTGGGTPSPLPLTYSLQSWMSTDLSAAWSNGYFGQGATIIVLDDFSSNSKSYGDLGIGSELKRHGEWTYTEAGMVAPKASLKSIDFNSGSKVTLSRSGLNVVNLSFGVMAQSGYSLNQVRFGAQESTVISYASKGSAVISKSAGNDAVAVGMANSDGDQDYLALALVGTKSAIFVGALDHNGTVENPASLASYSNYAGLDPSVQGQFLVVGVEGGQTGLYGTSFAAPIVSGYAAILGSKFKTAKPSAIKQQLLDTARTDTINNYDKTVYGRGEASISRAMAPSSIN